MVPLVKISSFHCLSFASGDLPRRRRRVELNPHDDPPPLEPPGEPEEPDDPDEIEMPCTDDAQWEVFIADDEDDPLPERGDFWIDDPEEFRGYCRAADQGEGEWRTANDA